MGASASWASDWLLKVEPSGSLEIYARSADLFYVDLNHLEETVTNKDGTKRLEEIYKCLDVQDPAHQALFRKFYEPSTAAVPKDAPTAAALQSRYLAMVGVLEEDSGAETGSSPSVCKK